MGEVTGHGPWTHIPDAPHNTYRCERCLIVLSGLEPGDLIRLSVTGIGLCDPDAKDPWA